jgi:NAD(P)-dependent dehydrogenase (short-subunit alcohol dehydrogenase family)
MDSTRHADRVALLTGAGSGIGLATAVRLAAEGAHVVGCDVRPEAVETARAAVPGGTFTACDVTDQAGVERLVSETVAAHGRIDVLGNIAGINDAFLAAHEVDDATWDRVLAVNTTAVMRLCRAVLPSMQARGAGAIVNIASIAGLGGGASGLAYTASKHAVVGMTRSIAWTYRADGVRCNAVCPGGVRTNIVSRGDPRSDWGLDRLRPFHALSGRVADADEIAALVSWLASDEASNMTGAIITADGGWTAG